MKKIIIYPLLFVFGFSTAQTNNGELYQDNALGLIVGSGVTFYKSNFSATTKVDALKTSVGNFSVEYFHPLLDGLVVKAGFLRNKFNYWDLGVVDQVNVSSELSSFNISADYRLDNGKILKKKSGFSPFVGLGIGYVMLKSSADYFDENGEKYHYWSDGVIRNVDEVSAVNSALEADTIRRDYVYETNFKDSLSSSGALQAFVEFGIGLKLNSNIMMIMSYKQSMVFDDLMKGVSTSETSDKFGYFSVGIGVNFGRTKKEKEKVEDEVEYSGSIDKEDEDNDGVIDLDDMCAHTPENTKVDSKGCPFDSDKDGVYDDIDVEPNSPNTNVNEKGKSYTAEEIEVLYLLNEGKMDQHEKYLEYKKKYDYLFEKFNTDKKSETLEHKSESDKE